MHLRNPKNPIAIVSREVQNRIYSIKEYRSAKNLSAQMAVEGLLAAIVLNLATGFTTMFATRMGANASQIGLVIALPQFFAMIILVPGSLLAGRIRDRRRPIEIAVVLAGLFYGLAGFSPFMSNFKVWFLIGMISLANVPIALYNTSWQNYFSDIVQPADRNSYYTLRTSMTFFAGIVVIQAVGIILGGTRSEQVRIWLYQGCYWLAFAITWMQLRILRQSPQDIGERSASNWRDLGSAIREMLRCRHFMVFLVFSFIFHCGWYMAWPLFFLLQVDYMGANEAWLSYIAVSSSLLQWLTVRPWGRFIERRGIRLALVIGCLGVAANPVFALLSVYLPAGIQLPGMLILNLVNSCTFSAFQLSILQCLLEAVPERFKSINLSIYSTVLLLAYSLTPILGVQLYNILGADLMAMTWSMAASIFVRLLGALLFLLRWHQLRHEPDCGIRA